jgi:hypothetical protein
MTPPRARRRKGIVHVAVRPKQCASFVYFLVTTNDWFDVGRVTIDMILPDEVLLDVFDCYVDQARERHELRGIPSLGNWLVRVSSYQF